MKISDNLPGTMIPIFKPTPQVHFRVISMNVYSRALDETEREQNMTAFSNAKSRYKQLYQKLLEATTERVPIYKRKSRKRRLNKGYGKSLQAKEL